MNKLGVSIRLNKLLAHQGWCSRREANRFIEQGLVKVNGVVSRDARVAPTDTVELLSQAVTVQAQQKTILVHKPVGYVSSQPETDSIPVAVQLLTADRQYQNAHRREQEQASSRRLFHPRTQLGWATAGRLDINSTGLLVLTQSGRVAKTLIGPDVRVDKEYLVRVRPSPFFDRNQSTAAVLERLRDGIRDAGELLHAVSVERVNTDQLRFVLHEGKHRHIRRMCRAVGLEVDGLKRVRIGEIVLGNLPVGQWRYLAPHESFVPTVESVGPQ